MARSYVCSRCYRNGHSSARCYAVTKLNGERLDDDTDEEEELYDNDESEYIGSELSRSPVPAVTQFFTDENEVNEIDYSDEDEIVTDDQTIPDCSVRRCCHCFTTMHQSVIEQYGCCMDCRLCEIARDSRIMMAEARFNVDIQELRYITDSLSEE